MILPFFCTFVFIPSVLSRADIAECRKSAKVENYLETAAELFEKLRDNIPVNGESNCACSEKPMDCSELLTCGFNESGIYRIWPRNRIIYGPIDVFCDMLTEGGGWTVIQRRGDFKRPEDFFYKNWHKYKTGFGDLRKDFWLGNDNIYALTNQNRYYLLFDLTDFEKNERVAFYDQFYIENENQNYKLHVHDYSGDAGDSFSKGHNGQMFSTMDRDNDNSSLSCAETHKGGWWYANCGTSNINGPYGSAAKSKNMMTWGPSIINRSEMKIRPSDFKLHLLDMDIEPV